MPRRQHTTPPRRVYRIGTQLRALLDERFVTQHELAHALGVRDTHVSRWCRNVNGTTKRRLRDIAEFFGVDPESLLEPDEPLVEPDDEPASPAAA